MRTTVVVAAALVALALGATIVAPTGSASVRSGDRSVPVTSVLAPPSPVLATDKRRHLVYEILVDNVTPSSVRFERLEVRDPARREVVASYRGRALEELLLAFDGGAPTRTLAPGQGGAFFLDVLLARRRHVPARLEHRFVLSLSRGDARRRLTTTGARTTVDRRAPIGLGPPLRGGDLLVVGCCSRTIGHRFALLEIDGRPFHAQRFAIDFVRIDDQVNTFAGDSARNESYFIFGAEVIAAAPGRVVATRDGVPENTPPNIPPEAMTAEGAAGNFATVDHGGGRFALYAHLQAGSVRVRPGEQVQRGQLLGLVGNTGNSDQAHLHFHVTDGPSNLAANGLAYAFDRFRLDGRVSGLESDPPAPALVPAPAPRERAGQYPLLGDVVAFP